MLLCTAIANKQFKLVKRKEEEASPFQLHIHPSVPRNDIIINDFKRTHVF